MTLESTTTDNEFAEAFESLAKMGDAPPADSTKPEEATNAPTDPVPASVDNVDAAGVPVPDAPADQPAAEPPVAADQPAVEPAPAAEPDADAILARLSQLVRDTKTETPAPVAQETPARTPAQEQQPEPELYTAEDKTFLDTYEKDWSDVSRGEALKRRAEYQQLVSHIYGELAKVIQPLRETVGVIAERTHLSDIKAAVPDYSDDMRSQVLDWVDRQPAYLKSAYEQVVTGGSPEEVQDLINRWSAETKAAPAAAPAPAQVQATRQAAAALAPVSTKRSAPPATDDMGNFDSAFAKFASEKLQ